MLRRTGQPPPGGAGNQHQTPYLADSDKGAETLPWRGVEGCPGRVAGEDSPIAQAPQCSHSLNSDFVVTCWAPPSWNSNLLIFLWCVPFHIHIFMLSGFLTTPYHLPPLSPLKTTSCAALKIPFSGLFMHSLWKCFPTIWDFSIRLFSFLGLQKERANLKKIRRQLLLLLRFSGMWWTRKMAHNLNRKSNGAKNVVNY